MREIDRHDPHHGLIRIEMQVGEDEKGERPPDCERREDSKGDPIAARHAYLTASMNGPDDDESGLDATSE